MRINEAKAFNNENTKLMPRLWTNNVVTQPTRYLDTNIELLKLTWNLTAPKRSKTFIQPGYQSQTHQIWIPKYKTTTDAE